MQTIAQDLRLTREIGNGGFSFIYLAENLNTKEKFAAKILRDQFPNAIEKLFREEEIQRTVSHHPNVARSYGCTLLGGKQSLLLEYIPGGDLFDFTVRRHHLPETEIKKVMASLFHAVAFLHANNIIHRDLKLENILIADTSDLSTVKITDFGLATIDSTNTITGRVGSYTYMAPEVYLRQGYGKEVDFWSLGVLAYTMFCGVLPFADGAKCEQQVLYSQPQFKESAWRHVSEEAKDLIRSLLVKDPRHRLTATQALHHPWLRHHLQAPALSSPTNSSEKKRKFSIMEIDDDSQCQEVEVRRISLKERKLTEEHRRISTETTTTTTTTSL